jgi:hypothetical protein
MLCMGMLEVAYLYDYLLISAWVPHPKVA